ncbi:MAG: hypothetical protein JNK05_41440 [Myxococcales bacterium]|nr:hypothetical protein [Myxococcales bacterium]
MIGSTLAPQLLCVAAGDAPLSRVLTDSGRCESLAVALSWNLEFRVDVFDPVRMQTRRWRLVESPGVDPGIWATPPAFYFPWIDGGFEMLFQMDSEAPMRSISSRSGEDRIKLGSSSAGSMPLVSVDVGDIVSGQGEDALVLSETPTRTGFVVRSMDRGTPMEHRVDPDPSSSMQYGGPVAYFSSPFAGAVHGYVVGATRSPAPRIAVARLGTDLRIDLDDTLIVVPEAGEDLGVSIAPVCDLDGDALSEFVVFSHNSTMNYPQLSLFRWSEGRPTFLRNIVVPGNHTLPELLPAIQHEDSCSLFVHSDRGAPTSDPAILPAVPWLAMPQFPEPYELVATTVRCWISIDSDRCEVVRQRRHGRSIEYRAWMSIAGSVNAPNLVLSESADGAGTSQVSIASIGRLTMGAWRVLSLPE